MRFIRKLDKAGLEERQIRGDKADMVMLDTEEQLLRAAEGRDVYIYGAGQIARTLLKRLKRYNINLKNLVTTSGTEILNGIEAVGGVMKYRRGYKILVQ